MKRIVGYSLNAIILSCLVFSACTRDDTPDAAGSLNLLTFKGSVNNPEVRNINVQSGEESNFNIDCFVLSSGVYDETTRSFGYTACDQTFRLVNPRSGQQLHSFAIPGLVAMSAVDDREHVLIGTYYDQDAEVNHIIRLDLDDGTLLSDYVVEGLGAMYTCSQFYNEASQTFHLITDENKLLTIDPATGTINSEVSINAGSNVIYYDAPNNTLLSLTYDRALEANFIEKTNAASGELMQRTRVAGDGGYVLCATDLEKETNSFVTVNAQNQVIFINTDSGEITNSYQFDQDVSAFIFWRQ